MVVFVFVMGVLNVCLGYALAVCLGYGPPGLWEGGQASAYRPLDDGGPMADQGGSTSAGGEGDV